MTVRIDDGTVHLVEARRPGPSDLDERRLARHSVHPDGCRSALETWRHQYADRGRRGKYDARRLAADTHVGHAELVQREVGAVKVDASAFHHRQGLNGVQACTSEDGRQGRDGPGPYDSSSSTFQYR